MALKKAIGDPTGEERACDGDEGHQFQGPASCGRDIGFHVKTHLILKVENCDLVRAGADSASAGIGSGVEPDKRVGEDGAEGFD